MSKKRRQSPTSETPPFAYHEIESHLTNLVGLSHVLGFIAEAATAHHQAVASALNDDVAMGVLAIQESIEKHRDAVLHLVRVGGAR